MARRGKIRLDHGGMQEMLQSGEVRAAIDGLAATVAASVAASPEVVRNNVPVAHDSYTTDRAAAAVSITHPAGLGLQAKYGTLTRAAGAAGLEVNERE